MSKEKNKGAASRPGLSNQIATVDDRTFQTDKVRIEYRIKMTYPDADGFIYEPGIGNPVIGNAYYIEFKSDELDAHESYYFCLVDEDEVEAFD